MKEISKSFVEKTFSLFLIGSLLVYQTPLTFAQGVDQNALPQEESLNTPTTTASGGDVAPAPPEPETPGDFLAQGPLQEPSIKTTIQEEEKARRDVPRELERYGFNRAVASLQDNVATAVILNKLSEKNLKELLSLEMEVGIAVLHGEIILFTSGNLDNIRVQAPILDMLKEASLIAHTHPEAGAAEKGPSAQDIALAVADPDEEYVLTIEGVYSYNSSGVLNGGVPSDFKKFVKSLHTARRVDRTSASRGSVKARGVLNEFIYQMDLFNDPTTRDEELFRSSGNVAPDGTKTTLAIDTLPNFSELAAISAGSFSPFSKITTLTYDTTQDGYAGAGFSFDNFGTGPIETADLSAIITAGLTLGLRGNPSQVKLEIVDYVGGVEHKDSVILTGVTAVNQVWTLTSADFSGVDLTKVRTLNFIIEDPPATPPQSGTLDVQIMSFLAPNTALTTSDITPLPATPQVSAFGSAANVNSQALNSTTARLTYDSSGGGLYASESYVFAQAVDLSGFPNLIFGLKGNPKQVKLEIFDNLNNTTTVRLSGLSASQEGVWSIPTSSLTGVDLTKITKFYFTVDDPNPAGTLDIEIKLATPTYPPILPLGVSRAPAVTTLPILPTPPSVFFVNNQPAPPTPQTSFLSQPAADEIRVTYSSLQTNEFVGPSMNYDDPLTVGTVESADLSSIANFVFGASGPAGKSVKVEFKDGTHQVTVQLNSLLTTKQFYSIPSALLQSLNSVLDLTHITEINFIADRSLMGATADSFSVFLKGQAFNPSFNHNAAANEVNALPFSSSKKQAKAKALGNGAFAQTNTKGSKTTYDFSGGLQFSGITIDFDNPATTTKVESAKWKLPKGAPPFWTFGLAGSSATAVRVRIEFTDSKGVKKDIFLNDVTNTLQFYKIPLTLIPKNVKVINFVLEGADAPSQAGSLELTADNLYYFEQPLASNPLLTAANVTTLPATPFTTFIGDDDRGDAAFVQLGTGGVELLYDNTTNHPNSYSGASINFTNTIDLSRAKEFVLGASTTSAGGGAVKIEFQDDQGKMERRILTGLTGTEQFYKITKTTFDDVNWAKIRYINVVAANDQLPTDKARIKVSIKGLKDPKALTPAQTALRQQIVSDNVKYFVDGLGVDTATQLPYDNIFYNNSNVAVANKFTQPTAIGFYAQILGDVVRGRTSIAGVTKIDALNRLNTMMTKLISAQADTSVSWNGLLLTSMNLSNAGVLTPAGLPHTIGLGDNSNLAQSIAVMIGALEGGTYSSTAELQAKTDAITSALQVLKNMGKGFNAFYDGATGSFRHSCDMDGPCSNTFSQYLDRMSNEFRATIGFLVTYYQDPAHSPAGTTITITNSAWDNLNTNLVAYKKNYLASDGVTTVPNAVPFDGAAFQMFWPLLRTNEENYVEMSAMLRNFLYSAADFARQNNLPGFPSAGMVPGRDYDVTLGIPDLSEDYLNNTAQATYNVGNIYGLASAYAIDPNFVLTWLDEIMKRNPGLVSPALGFYDSAISPTEIGQKHYAIDQASLVLALTNAGGDDFDVFMKNRSKDVAFRDLYRDVDMQLPQVNKPLPAPPTFPSETLTVFNHIASEGPLGVSFPSGTTAENGLSINYSGQTTDGGHYWEITGGYDARGAELRIDYSVTTTPQVFKIVLGDINDVILGTYTVNVNAAAGIHTASFQIPALTAFVVVRRIHVVVEPTQTGIQTANFFVHQIQFRRFNESDPSLTAANVTAFPPFPMVDSYLRNGGTVPFLRPYNTNIIDFNYDVSAQPDSYAGTTIHYDNFLTGPIEFADLSTKDPFVVGLSGPTASKLKVEFVDADGHTGTIVLENLSPNVQYFKIRRSDLAGGAVDFSRIAQINFLTDQGLAGGNNTGSIRIMTEGLKPTNILPTTSFTTYTVLPPTPVLSGLNTTVGTPTLNPTGVDTIQFGHTVATGGGYAGASLSYSKPKDFSKFSELAFGLIATAGTGQIKLEIKDASIPTPKVATLLLQYSSDISSGQYYRIPVSYLVGIDLTHIMEINFVADTAVTLVDGTVVIVIDAL